MDIEGGDAFTMVTAQFRWYSQSFLAISRPKVGQQSGFGLFSADYSVYTDLYIS